MAWIPENKVRRDLKLKMRVWLSLCTNCGADAPKYNLCNRCKERSSKTQRDKRAKRKEQNLCGECGKNKVEKGQYYCDDCGVKKWGLGECKTEGCNSRHKRGYSYCDECIEKREAEKQSCKVYFKNCLDCPMVLTLRHNHKAPRCDECNTIRWRKKNTGWHRTNKGLVEVTKTCAVCVEEYKTYKTNKHTCGEACSKRMMKQRENHKRRATKHGEKHIEKVDIGVLYLRDKGKCQLCNKDMHLETRVPHISAPTIDHITPLSLGGEHSYKNTQLACFICNSYKGNNIVDGGEQLKMFGI